MSGSAGGDDEADARYPVKAPGWRAIDRHLEGIYPSEVPHQFVSHTPYDEHAKAPLPAVSVYAAGSPSHWHFVSYGLTELFEKSSAKPDLSGFGFEVTLRLPRAPDMPIPPAWGVRLIQGIGYSVLFGGFTDGLETGDTIAFGGPLRPTGEGGSLLHGGVWVPDPDLGVISTAHGQVLFLQLYGLTAEELGWIEPWDMQRRVGLVRAVSRQHVTDPDRGSLMDDPAVAPIVRRYMLGLELPSDVG